MPVQMYLATPIRFLFSFLFLILFSVISSPTEAKTARYRCLIRDEPATTITIGWDQISGTSPTVYYGTTDFGKNVAAYTLKDSPQRVVSAKGMNNHYARLSKLKPNTVYYFIIVDSEGSSERFSFRTLPDDYNSRLSIVCGGDSRNLKAARINANKTVAKLRPHFVMFAGDMTGGDSDREWIEWFDDWQHTIGDDGRITAVIPARGNHEFSNKTITDMFDVRSADIYYALTFARGLLRVYTLNSLMPSSGEQRDWLEMDLRGHQDVAWRFAQYHHPMRPHTKRKGENETIRRNWAPLFERFRLQLALECDSHVSKYTWPIRTSMEKGNDEGFVRDDAHGVVYIGEGGWGAPLRDNNDDKKWTRASASINHVNLVFIDLDNMEVRTIKTDNINQVASLQDHTRFQLPSGIDLWRPEGLETLVISNRSKSDFRPQAKQILVEIQAAKAVALKDNAIEIFWKTVYEEDGMRYKIQYSQNKLYWKTLADLEGIGATAYKPNEYLFTDASQKYSGKVYYRITAIDASGNERYKQEIEVRSLSSYNEMELIAVNLSTGILNVALDLQKNEETLFELYDINRKLVFVQRMQLKAGNHSIPLNIRHLKVGFYLMEISYGQQLLRKNLKVYK